MSVYTFLAASDKKIFCDGEPSGFGFYGASCFKNEPFSFQLAYKSEKHIIPIYTEIIKDSASEHLSVFCVGQVPVINAASSSVLENSKYAKPGIYPDMLLRRKTFHTLSNDGFWQPQYFESGEKNLLDATPDSWQTLWFTFNESGTAPSGDYEIVIRLRSQKTQDILSENKIKLHIIDRLLPEQKTYYTNWFHYDCLSDTYNTEMWSERHFEIIRSFLSNAALHGMNTLLLPAFTPPLDTPVGKERKTAQLIKISKTGEKYSFDFSLLERFLQLALSCGIKYFEHSHLFTQWGAKHTPKITADINGIQKQIFGWETDAHSPEYSGLLKAYIPKLLSVLEKYNLKNNIIFHISDEPRKGKLFDTYYLPAIKQIKDVVDRQPIGDALIDFDCYKKSGIDIPIVNISGAEDFSAKCKNFWTYYTGETSSLNYTNRLITTPNSYCRILGVQMYYYGITGFLHWGYNYYYNVLSHGLFNPCCNPCGYSMQPGTSFIVYPSADGSAIPSIREKLMMEAMCDIRALELLEQCTDRRLVINECEKFFEGFSLKMTQRQTEKLFAFRQRINTLIENQ